MLSSEHEPLLCYAATVGSVVDKRTSMPERTILIVEDDKALIDVLKYNLIKEGYSAVSAHLIHSLSPS